VEPDPVGHYCSGGRGAGAIGGWPETRCAPAPFRIPLLIPPGGRGAGAIGGWPETRCAPAPFRIPLLIPPGGRGAGAIGGWPETRCAPAPFRIPLLIPPGGRGAGAIGGWPETRCAPAPFRQPLSIPASRKAGMLAPAFGSGEDEAIGVAPGRLVGDRVLDRLTARREVRALEEEQWRAGPHLEQLGDLPRRERRVDHL